jgi:hypothetical protein
VSAGGIARGALPALLLALTTSLVSCAHWRQQWVPPESVVAGERPEQIQLTRRDGRQIVLSRPVVTQDSLVGDREGRRCAIALSDIDHVSLRRGSSLLGAVLIPLGVILGFGVLIAATWD